MLSPDFCWNTDITCHDFCIQIRSLYQPNIKQASLGQFSWFRRIDHRDAQTWCKLQNACACVCESVYMCSCVFEGSRLCHKSLSSKIPVVVKWSLPQTPSEGWSVWIQIWPFDLCLSPFGYIIWVTKGPKNLQMEKAEKLHIFFFMTDWTNLQDKTIKKTSNLFLKLIHSKEK